MNPSPSDNAPFSSAVPSAGRRNVELKARLASLDEARRIARELTGREPQVEEQVDTYFHCPRGRLKLREIAGRGAQLIGYDRPDQSGPKASHYYLVAIADGAAAKGLLTAALGVRAVVSKRREIHIHENVRIHLDEVAGLGAFLEFEAVFAAGDDLEGGPRQVEVLARRFGLDAADRVACSYGELVGERRPHDHHD